MVVLYQTVPCCGGASLSFSALFAVSLEGNHSNDCFIRSKVVITHMFARFTYFGPSILIGRRGWI